MNKEERAWVVGIFIILFVLAMLPVFRVGA
jgi:hypothetical protein